MSKEATSLRLLEYDDLLNLKKISRTVVINQGNEGFDQFCFSNEHLVSRSLIRFKLNKDMHLAIKRLVLYKPLRFYHLRNFDKLTNLFVSFLRCD